MALLARYSTTKELVDGAHLDAFERLNMFDLSDSFRMKYVAHVGSFVGFSVRPAATILSMIFCFESACFRKFENVPQDLPTQPVEGFTSHFWSTTSKCLLPCESEAFERRPTTSEFYPLRTALKDKSLVPRVLRYLQHLRILHTKMLARKWRRADDCSTPAHRMNS